MSTEDTLTIVLSIVLGLSGAYIIIKEHMHTNL